MTEFDPKPCAQCGVIFTPSQKQQKYCSNECALKAVNERKLENARMRKVSIIECIWCHTKVKSHYKNGLPSTFCSYECAYKFRKLQKRIFKTFNLNHDLELSRLKKLGNKYSFPSPFEKFNKFYQLPKVTSP